MKERCATDFGNVALKGEILVKDDPKVTDVGCQNYILRLKVRVEDMTLDRC